MSTGGVQHGSKLKAPGATVTTRAIDHTLYQRQARLCRVLADPKRLHLLHSLRLGERSVGELAEELGASYPNVSQHLNSMRDVGVVATRKEGTTVFYHLAYPRLLDACDIVQEILQSQLADAVALRLR